MEDTARRFILKSFLRYLVHFMILILFALALFNWYSDFQNFAVKAFSKIKYVSASGDASDEFSLMALFIVLCYRAEFLLLRKYKQNEYLIPVLLIPDIICLFITNLIMIFYNNWSCSQLGWAEVKSLNNILVVFSIWVLKDLFVQSLLKKRYSAVPRCEYAA